MLKVSKNIAQSFLIQMLLGKKELEKAQFSTDNPFEELKISDTVQLIPVALTSMTQGEFEGFRAWTTNPC